MYAVHYSFGKISWVKLSCINGTILESKNALIEISSWDATKTGVQSCLLGHHVHINTLISALAFFSAVATGQLYLPVSAEEVFHLLSVHV